MDELYKYTQFTDEYSRIVNRLYTETPTRLMDRYSHIVNDLDTQTGVRVYRHTVALGHAYLPERRHTFLLATENTVTNRRS